MGSFVVGRYAVSIGAAVLLAACGALGQAQDDMQPPIGTPAILPEIETAITGPAAKICGVEILHAFTGDHGYFPNGWGPSGLRLVNGNIVGTTYYGGSSDHGTVYTLASSGQYNVLYSFKGSPDGYGPGGLILDNGNYYGLTNRGGLYDGGSVFEITPSGQEHVVYSFGRDKLDGAFPVGMMLYDGKFYGTTYYGGGHGGGWGTVFEVSPDGEERILHRFGARKDDYAGTPGADLTVLNGILYGTAGTSKHGYGTIYSLTPSGHYENIHTFTGPEGGNGVIASYHGALFGTTNGGIAGKHFIFYRGAFFEMRRPGDFHIITRLGNQTDRPGGLQPVDGAFYFGMGPGPYKNGGIHKLTLSGDESLVCWFKLRPHGHNDDQHGGNGVGLTYQSQSLYGQSLWGGPHQAGGGTLLKVTTPTKS
jgi:uncharacterized repeat protein (TIGR03803 family)